VRANEWDWSSGIPDAITCGRMVRFTLAQAYDMAAKGDYLSTIDPAEFATMTEAERRYHRRTLKQIAKDAA
jgi:hypothetical protein